jgi:hypothetical protein
MLKLSYISVWYNANKCVLTPGENNVARLRSFAFLAHKRINRYSVTDVPISLFFFSIVSTIHENGTYENTIMLAKYKLGVNCSIMYNIVRSTAVIKYISQGEAIKLMTPLPFPGTPPHLPQITCLKHVSGSDSCRPSPA